MRAVWRGGWQSGAYGRSFLIFKFETSQSGESYASIFFLIVQLIIRNFDLIRIYQYRY